jgi:hypothetical protein
MNDLDEDDAPYYTRSKPQKQDFTSRTGPAEPEGGSRKNNGFFLKNNEKSS